MSKLKNLFSRQPAPQPAPSSETANKVAIQQARAKLSGSLNRIKKAAEDLREKNNALEAQICQALRVGNEFQARLDCIELNGNQKIQEKYYTVAFRLKKALSNFDMKVSLGEASRALSSVQNLCQLTDNDWMVLLNEENNDEVLDELFGSVVFDDEESKKLYDKFSNRIANEQAGEVPSSLDTDLPSDLQNKY